MRQSANNRRNFVLGILFLILFVFYYSGITFFPHAHVHNHTTIVHSHPYQKDSQGNPTHTHNKTEFALIAVLSHMVMTGAVFFVVWTISQMLFYRKIHFRGLDFNPLTSYIALFNPRSPPFIFAI
ncbi:MAG: hypothetical protein PHG27_05435 [Massilibacteroides sp.]|nr:hypothetical protein [Massilibacteroides sp.]MDD4115027.1 hypothetical protein [Massilibacteroides sp.]MDD4660296.1 hypothetical protein [Massilibacteroides sp.]